MSTRPRSSATSARGASMPSMTGICTDMSTTSGCSARAWSSAVAPLSASPTTSRSGSTESIIRKPERTSCWSSTMSTRRVTAGSGTVLLERHPDAHPVATGGAGPDLDLAAHPGCALTHPEVTQARAGRRTARAAVVEHLDLGVGRGGPVLHAQHDAGRARGRVPGGVGQRLLCDAVEREPQGSGKLLRGTGTRLDLVVGGDQAGCRALGSQRRQVAHPGLRGAAVALGTLLAEVAQRAEQAAHLGDRLARGALDDAERSGRRLGVAADDPTGCRRLDADDRHVVADDVVQLAGDAQPLVGDRASAQGVALEVDGARLLGQLGLLAGV